MTVLAYSSVPTKVLFIEHPFSFFPSFCHFITDNCNYGSLFREDIKMKIFLSLLTKIYPKINMNVVKTILPRQ